MYRFLPEHSDGRASANYIDTYQTALKNQTDQGQPIL